MIQFQDKSADFAVSMAMMPASKDIAKASEIKAIYQHIELLLMMKPNALIGRPGVCVGLPYLLFENFSGHDEKLLKRKIQLAMRFEPRAKLLDVKFNPQFDSGDLEIEVRFEYRLTQVEYKYLTTLRRVL